MSLGFVATCNAGGANKWLEELNRHFQGLTVYILPDNDDAGRSHADMVATALHGIADGVRIVDLPGLPKSGDVSDWLDLGGDAGRLVALCQAAPHWEPHALDRAPEQPPESAVLIPYCDESLTLIFSGRHTDDLRYCETFGGWFEWDGGRWRHDIKRGVFSHARRLCRNKSAEALVTILTAWCELHGIPYQGVPVGTIKRHVTGKGNADKQAVIDAVRRLGFAPADDNEADALALLHWTIANGVGVVR